jgi:hypothetical protein
MDEPSGGRWVETEMGSVWKPASKKRSGQTPHALLKHRCRNALTAFRQAHGLSVVLLPSIVGRIKTMAGQEISVGKKGQADDTIIIGKDGVLWGVVMPEYKAGKDTQKEAQKAFQERAELAGAMYVICRQPSDLTDALMQIAAQKGVLF